MVPAIYESQVRQLDAELHRETRLGTLDGGGRPKPIIAELQAKRAVLDAQFALEKSPWPAHLDALAAIAAPRRLMRHDPAAEAQVAAIVAVIAERQAALVDALANAVAAWTAHVERREAKAAKRAERTDLVPVPARAAPGWQPATPADVARIGARRGVVVGRP